MGRYLIATVAYSTAACSVLVDSGREQCAVDRDCQKRGGVFARALCSNSVCVTDAQWGCVGSVVWPMVPPIAVPEKVTVKLTLSDLLSGDLLSGATARVCGKLDPKCDSPTQTDLRSDDAGVLTVTLNKFFDGYFEIKYSTPELFYVDTIYSFNPPVDADRNIPFIPLVPFTALEVFGAQLNMQPLPDRGTVIGLAYDCQGNSAEGIKLSSDEADDKTSPFYMVSGIPRLDATQTDKSGQGGIANVAVGARLISGRRASTGELIGTVSVQTRPIWITYTSMLPTPLSMQK
ncbi:MAG TPA: hypothetical protein VK540_14545 [Polyangiaceae bacterium]|jgi:hypothetical protein|nr:hypothetical protein [Polyangiaceae bacterium]